MNGLEFAFFECLVMIGQTENPEFFQQNDFRNHEPEGGRLFVAGEKLLREYF